MKRLFLFLGIATLVLSNQYVPIPNKPFGVSKGDSKKLIIEAFFDLQCPDSRDSFRILEQVLAQGYGTQFKYTIHMFSLPYHRAGFPEAQGFAFLSEINPEAAFLFAKTIFDNQETLAEAATLDWTWQEILNKVAQFAKENVYPKYQYDEAKFAKSLLPGTDWNLKARYWWKYGIIDQLKFLLFINLIIQLIVYLIKFDIILNKQYLQNNFWGAHFYSKWCYIEWSRKVCSLRLDRFYQSKKSQKHLGIMIQYILTNLNSLNYILILFVNQLTNIVQYVYCYIQLNEIKIRFRFKSNQNDVNFVQIRTNTAFKLDNLLSEDIKQNELMYIFGQEIQNVDSFLQLKETFIWFSYRANIQYEGKAISDQGWGCLIRVGQMIVANSLIRDNSKSNLKDLKTKLINLFDDNENFSTLAPLSIQQIIKKAALIYNLQIGDWYTGPKIMCLLEELFLNAKTIKQLKIINFLEQCIIEQQIDLQFTQPQLLIIHAIIGNKELDQYSVVELQKHMQIPQFAGAIVGKSKKAYFLIGYQNNQGIIMDPHYVQESNLIQLNSQLKCIPLKQFSGIVDTKYQLYFQIKITKLRILIFINSKYRVIIIFNQVYQIYLFKFNQIQSLLYNCIMLLYFQQLRLSLIQDNLKRTQRIHFQYNR